MIKRASAVAVAAALVCALGLGACSDEGPGEGQAVLTVEGEAVVARAGGETDTVTRRATVDPGDRVEAVHGTFQLALPGGAGLEGREARGGQDATRVTMGEVPDLEAGDLLVLAGDGAAVSAAGTTFTLEPTEGRQSVARVSRSLAVAAATYAGVVTLDSAGQHRTIPALRAMEVSALGRPPAEPRPLAYDETDPWDQRYLGEAMELGRRLEAMARAYTGSLGPDEGRTPGFFRLVLPALEDESAFGTELIDQARAPGETLVGATIAVLSRAGGFGERWQAIFRFRDAGAAWGLVALDQGVGREPLLGAVEDALNATAFEFTAPTPAPPPAAAPPPTTVAATPATSTPDTATPTTPGSAPTTTAPPLPPSGGELLPDTGIPLIDQLIDPVENLIIGLLGG